MSSRRRRQGTRTRPAAPQQHRPAVPTPAAPAPVASTPVASTAVVSTPVEPTTVEPTTVAPAPVEETLSGLDVLLQRARLTVAAAHADGETRGGLSLRTAGIPLLAAAVVGGTVGGTATGAAASTPSRGAVPQAGSHAASVAGAAVRSTAAVRTGASAASRGAARTASRPVVTYVVKSGDTLSEIAHRAGITLRSLLAANHLRATDVIRPGQRLVLPGVAAPKAPKPKPVVYVVRAGDTVSGIALRYRITVAAIVKANRLGPQAVIRPGQKLVLPGVKPAARKPKPPATHTVTVRAGDTLSGIAHREKVTLASLLALNHLTVTAVIHPGQKLLVPGPPKAANTFAGRTYPDAVVRAAAANRAVLAKRDVPSRAQMRALVARTAKKFKVPPELAMAIAYQESGFNMRAVSVANAIGCMQVIPSSGVWASRLVGRRLDLLDPEDNVTAGVAIIAALLRSAKDERTAIAGYYQGLGSVNKNGMFPDTRRYVANVQRLEHRFT